MTQFNTQVCVWEDSCLPFKFLNNEAFVDSVEKLSFYLTKHKVNLYCKGKVILYTQNGLSEKCKVLFVKQVAKVVFRNRTEITNKMHHCTRICYSSVYQLFSMFRATHRSSSGAQICNCSLWFLHTSVVAGIYLELYTRI